MAPGAAAGPSAAPQAASPAQEALPREARVIALILASKGIQDASPQVLHQLLEFTHRYTSDILLDALNFSDHASKNGKIDLEDIQLAVQGRINYSFTGPPEKDYLHSLATELNSHPLPPVAESASLRLPPPRYQVTAPNFDLVPSRPPAGYQAFQSVDNAYDSAEDVDQDEEDEEVYQPQQQHEEGLGVEDDYEDDDDEGMKIDAPPQMMPQQQTVQVVGNKRRMDEEDDDYD